MVAISRILNLRSRLCEQRPAFVAQDGELCANHKLLILEPDTVILCADSAEHDNIYGYDQKVIGPRQLLLPLCLSLWKESIKGIQFKFKSADYLLLRAAARLPCLRFARQHTDRSA